MLRSKVYVNDIDEEGNPVKKMVETSVGRLMVNEFVPEEVGYINEVLGKKALRDIIGKGDQGLWCCPYGSVLG